MKNDLVSIITPSYNTGRFIAETIESVLAQTYKNWEMLIVDDNSTDNTDEVVKKYLKNERIKYIKNSKNCGAAISRNKALKLAKGKWIAFLDSDDLWESDKLEKQINFMIRNNYHFSYTAYEEIDECSKPMGVLVKGPKRITQRIMYNYCYPGCLTVMYDRQKIGLVQIENLSKNNDYAMWLKVIKKSDCYFLDECLAKYRKRKGSISNYRKFKIIKFHYFLYRVGEKRSVMFSILLTIKNIFYGILKKIIYVKKTDV